MNTLNQKQIERINELLNRRLRARTQKGGLKLWLIDACNLIRSIDGTEFAGSARCDGFVAGKLESFLQK